MQLVVAPVAVDRTAKERARRRVPEASHVGGPRPRALERDRRRRSNTRRRVKMGMLVATPAHGRVRILIHFMIESDKL